MGYEFAGRFVRLCRCVHIVTTAVGVLLAGICPERAAATMLPPGTKADRVIVLKSARVLELLRHGVVLKIYPIALGPSPIGPKRTRGDGKTPEGIYLIDTRHDHSPYQLALHVSYPNPVDRARSAKTHLDPGDNIFIHGLPSWYGKKDPDRFYKDWTEGCISVGNTAIREIWASVNNGTPIEIRP